MRKFSITAQFNNARRENTVRSLFWTTPRIDESAINDLFVQLGKQEFIPASSFAIIHTLELEVA